MNDVTSVFDEVTSPDFDDFLYWKTDVCLSPEEIDCVLLGGGGGSDGKKEKERENEERKRMSEEEITSWGDLGRKAREHEDDAVT